MPDLPEHLAKKRPEQMTDDELDEAAKLHQDYSSYHYDEISRYSREKWYRNNPEMRPPSETPKS